MLSTSEIYLPLLSHFPGKVVHWEIFIRPLIDSYLTPVAAPCLLAQVHGTMPDQGSQVISDLCVLVLRQDAHVIAACLGNIWEQHSSNMSEVSYDNDVRE